MKSSIDFERPLRAEQPLDVHAAQAGRVDAAAVALRPDVARQVGRRRRVAVDVAIEAGHALHADRLRRLAVGGGVELLLRELRHQQTQALQVLGVEDAGEDLLEVVHRHDFALRDVAQVGPRGQVDGRRELGQEVLGQVEIEVEAFQPRQQLDLHLGEDHAPGLVLGVGQGQKALGEQSLVADLLAGHRGQLVPGHSLRQLGGRADLDRLAAGHGHLRVGPRSEVVALLQQLLLAGHDRFLVGLVLGHHGLETLLAQQDWGDLVVARRRGLRAPDRWNHQGQQDGRDDQPRQPEPESFSAITLHGMLLKWV